MQQNLLERIDPPDRRSDSERSEVFDVSGHGREAGAQYGEACRDLIEMHLASVYARASQKDHLDGETVRQRTVSFREAVRQRLPDLCDEIDGIALGARIRNEEAWLLQLRSEISRVDPDQVPAECTAIGGSGSATFAGTTIAGQNGDLPNSYRDVLTLVRRNPPGAPRSLSVAPAGQISWHGMNEHGVAVFANFLYSDGWQVGIPRYLMSRIAMGEPSALAAVDRITSQTRSASRNLLIADPNTVVDLELGVTTAATLPAEDGVLAHTNHWVSDLSGLETADAEYVANSRARLERANELLAQNKGRLDVTGATRILRDRQPPHFISIELADGKPDQMVTVASTIADTGAGVLWIASGPPHLNSYFSYIV